jgi:hypothetical protein
MQPYSFSKDLLKLDLPTIRQAMTTFHNKLHLKDIQCSENNKEKQQTNVTTKKDLDNGNISKNKIPCPNCVAAGRPSGHRIWFCNNIDYCSICQSSHLAMGPDCPKRNKETFDYDQFMSNREKKRLKDGNIPSTGNKHGNKKSNVQVTSKDSSTIASASTVPVSCPVQSNPPSAIDKKLKKLQLLQKMERLKKEVEGLSSDSDEVNNVSLNNPVNAFYDSGCNLTTVTNSQQSDSNAIITRNPCKDCHYVFDAIGTEILVNDFAFLLNHKANVVDKFVRPFLSVSQVNLSNNVFSLFTSDKWNRKLQSYVSKILQHASSSNLMVVQGIQCNAMYEIPISDCLN